MQQLQFEYEGSDLEALGGMVNYQNWILSHFSEHIHGDVLEIGAGIGSFSELIIPKCKTLSAIEPDKNQFSELQKRIGSTENVSLFNGLSEDYFDQLNEDQKFDAIVMINVLEHIEDDVQTLKSLYKALKPGGRILIFVPAGMWLYSKFDELVGHYRRYHKDELKTKTLSAKFDVEKIRYFDFAGIFPWWLINKKMAKTEVNPKLAAIYDKFIVPVSVCIEKVISPPVGKNLVMVAIKKESE